MFSLLCNLVVERGHPKTVSHYNRAVGKYELVAVLFSPKPFHSGNWAVILMDFVTEERNFDGTRLLKSFDGQGSK